MAAASGGPRFDMPPAVTSRAGSLVSGWQLGLGRFRSDDTSRMVDEELSKRQQLLQQQDFGTEAGLHLLGVLDSTMGRTG